MAKILFTGRSKAHFSYYETVLSYFVANGHELILSFDEEWTTKGEKKAGIKHHAFENWIAQNPDVEVLWHPIRENIRGDLKTKNQRIFKLY